MIIIAITRVMIVRGLVAAPGPVEGVCEATFGRARPWQQRGPGGPHFPGLRRSDGASGSAAINDVSLSVATSTGNTANLAAFLPGVEVEPRECRKDA